MKNSSDTIRNRTRDLPTCSAVPQPRAPRVVNLEYIETSGNRLLYLLRHVYMNYSLQRFLQKLKRKIPLYYTTLHIHGKICYLCRNK
jgi:hypothetical protein